MISDKFSDQLSAFPWIFNHYFPIGKAGRERSRLSLDPRIYQDGLIINPTLIYLVNEPVSFTDV